MENRNLKEYIQELSIENSKVINRLEKSITISSKLDREKYIYDTWNVFRCECIDKVNNKILKVYKSPELSNEKNGLKDIGISFSYERNVQSDILESMAVNLRQHNKNWLDDHVIFSSGMAALSNLILNFKTITRNRGTNKFKVVVWGAYFETRVFLDFLKDDNLEWICCISEEELCEVIEREDFDILLLEPVRYDWELDVLNVAKVLEYVKKLKSNKYRLIVFDTTLISESMPMAEILDYMEDVPYAIVAQFNSLLKLNQEGLEFANAGLISLYTNNKYFKDVNSKSICEYLRKMRTIFGTGLDLRENLLLNNPFTFNREKVIEYSGGVFKNNNLMAESIGTEGIFQSVVHPSIGERKDVKWAKAPFVIFKLKEDILNNYGLLLSILIHESRKRNLNFHMGSSFGFRNCRFEVIIPKVVDKRGIFKIAMGYQSGEMVNKIIELVQEIANYKSIQELREKYNDVEAIDLESIE